MSQKSCCVPECLITAENAAIYKQEDTTTDNDETNINILMKGTHNYLNDEYSELTIEKTYDDDQKVYIEIETKMDLSYFENDKNCIKREKENSDVIELVQQVSKDYGTHVSSIGNNVKIKNVDCKVYIRPKNSEEVTNESLKITNEDLQIKIEIDVNDEDKEKIVENDTGVRVDLSLVKQEVDNGFHMQIKGEQNKVDDLGIKKEVEDCDEVFKGIFEVYKSESDFEADDDTNIGAIITETETRVEPKPKDNIQCNVDSNVLNRNLRTIARVNTFRMQKRKKFRRKASGDTYNCTKCLCIFESFYRYVSHFFLHDIKPNACPLCETSYESVKPLSDHIRNFHIAKSFISLRVSNHEFDKMKTYKCLVCEDIVIEQHCFNHWEKHFRFKASKQRLGLTSLDSTDVDRKLENTFSAKVIKKFKGMNDTEKDAMIIDKGTEESVQITCINDINEDIEENQHNSNGGDALRHVDYEMKCYDSGEDTDTVVVREKLRSGLHLNKYGSLDSSKSSPLPTHNNKPKTSAVRQREYRLRLKERSGPKKQKENGPTRKSAAERQREYRLRKKNKNVKAESNSDVAQVIPNHIFVEPVDSSVICSKTSPLPIHNNKPKTSAVRQREYRLRLKERSGPKKKKENRPVKKSAAERQREYRLRLKERSGPKKKKENRPVKKSAAERQREYRLRLKERSGPKIQIENRSAEISAVERHREYRLRMKERSGPKKQKDNRRARKSAAERQRECRLRKKMKSELNSDVVEIIPRQGAGFSGYLTTSTEEQLMRSSPDNEPVIIHHESVNEDCTVINKKT